MGFFEDIANFFNPARGVARGVARATNNLVLAENQRRQGLLQEYFPEQNFRGRRNTSNDRYLFSDEAIKDVSRANVASLFKQEYGEDLLQEFDEGFEAQKPRLFDLLAKQENEVKAGRQQGISGVENMREARLGNQTGGVRNGIARNPFNMNMMRGPMNSAPKKPSASSPVRGGVTGSAGGVTGSAGGGRGMMSDRNYLLA